MRRVTCCLFAALIALTGCGTRVAGSGADGAPGWSEIAPAPYDAGLLSATSFWAGDRLVVTGGYSLGDEVTFSDVTYVYDPEANVWGTLPLRLPNVDGIIAGDGTWTGQEWVGWVVGCRSGALIEDEPLNNCDAAPIIAHWNADAGWSSSPLPTGAVTDTDTLIASSGHAGTASVFSTQAGFTVVDSLKPDAAPTFRPWPASAAPYDPHAGCVVDSTIVTISSTAGFESAQNLSDSVPQHLTGNVVSLSGELLGQFPILDVPRAPPFPFCQPGVGLYLDGVTFSIPLRVVGNAGVRELSLAPTVGDGDLTKPIANVNSLWVDVEGGILSLDNIGLSSFFLDAETGETTALRPVPRLNSHLTVWTGKVVLAQLLSSNRWFMLIPGPWQDAGTLPPFDVA